jgi:uncharacterized protein YoxC
MSLHDEQQVDQLMVRFEALIRRIEARQTRLESRLAFLYQLVFGAVIVLVASLSFLTIILSRQLPDATAAVTRLNDKFAVVADDMVGIERSVRIIDETMETLPEMIGHVDRIHGGVAFMSQDVTEMSSAVSAIERSVGTMTGSLTDMRQSFEFVEHNVLRMRQDVDRLSQPMRLFNWMNPLW